MINSRPITLLLCLFFLAGAISGQQQETESGWIDVEGKSDSIRQILSTFKNLTPILPAKLAEREKTVNNAEIIQERISEAKKSDLARKLNNTRSESRLQDRKVRDLIEDRGTASSRIEDLHNKIAILDSSNLRSRRLIDAERESVKETIIEIPFYAVGIGRAPNIGKPAAIKERINSQVVRTAIEAANGVQIIRKIVIVDGLLTENWIQTVISGKANHSLRGSLAPYPDDPVKFYMYQYGIIEIFPLQEGIQLGGSAGISLQDVEAEIVTSTNTGLAADLSEQEKGHILEDLAKAERKNNGSEDKLKNHRDSALLTIESYEKKVRENEDDISRYSPDLTSTKSRLERLDEESELARTEQTRQEEEYELHKVEYTAYLASEERLEIITRKGRQEERSMLETFEMLMHNTYDGFKSFATTYRREVSEVPSANGSLFQDMQSKQAGALLKEIKILGLTTNFDPDHGDLELSATVVYRFGFEYVPEPPRAILELDSKPTGAQVKIDGQIRGETPLNLTMEPGHYELNISLEGYQPWIDSVKVSVDSNNSFSPELPLIIEDEEEPIWVPRRRPEN